MMWWLLVSIMASTSLQGPFWGRDQCEDALFKAINDRAVYRSDKGYDLKPEEIAVCVEGFGLHALKEKQ